MNINFPIDTAKYIFKERRFLKEAQKVVTNRDIKIKFIGGYTQNSTRNWLEIFLRNHKINCKIDESDWGPFFQFIADTSILESKPDMIVIFILPQDFYSLKRGNSPITDLNLFLKQLENFVSACKEKNIFVSISLLDSDFINFPSSDNPSFNLLRVKINGFLSMLINENKNIKLFSLSNICAGFDHDPISNYRDWYAFGQPYSLSASFFLANHLINLIRGRLGMQSKALIVDLDNTLWGGVIGDDGLEGIQLGDETAEGRIFKDIQSYIFNLKKRGVFLAIASKNEIEIAKEGFLSKSSILKLSDFTKYEINWGIKSDSIKRISKYLNIGLDSLVFLDDNPTEREEVRIACPDVLVLSVTNDPITFLQALRFVDPFCVDSLLTSEDLLRNEGFLSKANEEELIENSDSYEKFLAKLDVRVEINELNDVSFERTLQLNNKTNQFNFTTLRLTADDLNKNMHDKNKINLTYSASDQFSDYGQIGIVFLERKSQFLVINNWIMSCRVFKKTIEHFVLQEIIKVAIEHNLNRLQIKYNPNKKNKILIEFLEENNFKKIKNEKIESCNEQVWEILDLSEQEIKTFVKENS